MGAPIPKGPCLVTRATPFRDADVIVTLLSPEHGRIDAVARGARSSRRRFGGALRPFCEVDVALQVGRGSLPLLVRADPQHAWLAEGVGYDQLCLASYVTELGLVATQPEHADPELHGWLRHWLALAEAPVSGSLRSLRLGGVRKVAEGVTTLEEVLRSTPVWEA